MGDGDIGVPRRASPESEEEPNQLQVRPAPRATRCHGGSRASRPPLRRGVEPRDPRILGHVPSYPIPHPLQRALTTPRRATTLRGTQPAHH